MPWIDAKNPHDGTALLVGGGPSLASSMAAIGRQYDAGVTIFALNGAAEFLRRRGIVPDWQVIIDARPQNVRFLEGRSSRGYLISSQCDPSLFDFLANEKDRVRLFHIALENLGDLLPKNRNYTAVGGGITSGLTAMALACTMGYRTLHLYGYDSSDAEGQSHAYSQPETEAENRRLDVVCAGKHFRTSFAMYKQAESFPAYASLLAENGCTILVHGQGLLPTIAREMIRPHEPGCAVYDLATAPASWDFVVWLVAAEMGRRARGEPAPLRVAFSPGPNGGFRNDDLPMDVAQRQQMLDKVMRPALALIGAVEDPAAVNGAQYNYMLRQISDAARHSEEVPTLDAPPQALKWVDEFLTANQIVNPVVITLREASHWPHRNSNTEAWFAFANKLIAEGQQVLFVRDTEKTEELLPVPFLHCSEAATDLHIRAALYARAKCNLLVANGPVALAYFGKRPFLIFKPLTDGYGPGTADWWKYKIGVSVGEQYPWANPDQKIVWADDTFEEIERAWGSLNLS